jgi:hypothetical protein
MVRIGWQRFFSKQRSNFQAARRVSGIQAM